jgi:hypothetical protein
VLAFLLAVVLFFVYRRKRQEDARSSSASTMLKEPLMGKNDTNVEMGAIESPIAPQVRPKRQMDPNDAQMYNTVERSIKPWKIDFSKLQLGQPIGSGAQGVVFEGTYAKTSEPIAIKRLTLSLKPEVRKKEIKAAQQEMQVLWTLRNPVRLSLVLAFTWRFIYLCVFVCVHWMLAAASAAFLRGGIR